MTTSRAWLWLVEHKPCLSTGNRIKLKIILNLDRVRKLENCLCKWIFDGEEKIPASRKRSSFVTAGGSGGAGAGGGANTD